MKRPYRAAILLAALVGICLGIIYPVTHATAATDVRTELASNDIAAVSVDIRQTFSEFLTLYTGVLDWQAIAGAPDSAQNVERVSELRKVMPLAVVEGLAFDLVAYRRDYGPIGSLEVWSPDRASCLIGALVAGFNQKYQVELAQDERNWLQAMIYQQFDRLGITVDQAHQLLLLEPEMPKGVDGFDRGLDGSLPACGIVPPRLI